jgi:hypothetical protein
MVEKQLVVVARSLDGRGPEAQRHLGVRLQALSNIGRVSIGSCLSDTTICQSTICVTEQS